MTLLFSNRWLWIQRGLTALAAALAAASVVFWVLQILALPTPTREVRWVDTAPAQQAYPLSQALGANKAASVEVAPDPGLTLLAVIAQAGHRGAALIAAAGQKPQTHQVGDEVQAGRFLVEVGLRSAGLGPTAQGPVTEVLTIPVPALPSAP
ncbi:MAG: hypothetical protein RIT26_2202 [Pseudomonadota bacterium]|jgi:hypothetical protein